MNYEFKGSDYDEDIDFNRLSRQIEKVREFCLSKGWVTLSQIERSIREPHASISAQLRNLRKEKNGSWIVEKRRVITAHADSGLFEYKLRARTSKDMPLSRVNLELAKALVRIKKLESENMDFSFYLIAINKVNDFIDWKSPSRGRR